MQMQAHSIQDIITAHITQASDTTSEWGHMFSITNKGNNPTTTASDD